MESRLLRGDWAGSSPVPDPESQRASAHSKPFPNPHDVDERPVFRQIPSTLTCRFLRGKVKEDGDPVCLLELVQLLDKNTDIGSRAWCECERSYYHLYGNNNGFCRRT